MQQKVTRIEENADRFSVSVSYQSQDKDENGDTVTLYRTESLSISALDTVIGHLQSHLAAAQAKRKAIMDYIAIEPKASTLSTV